MILGHSRLAVTLEVYTLTDEPAQRDALTKLRDLYDLDYERDEEDGS